jgi:hypothetical protein
MERSGDCTLLSRNAPPTLISMVSSLVFCYLLCFTGVMTNGMYFCILLFSQNVIL